MRVAITGGVTGGHLFPALVVGQALQAQGHEVLYLGTQHGLEARINLPIPAELIPMEGLRSTRRTPWGVVLTLWRARRTAKAILQSFRPDLLFTTGGYPSVPIASAFLSLKRPLILLEPDAYPGKANRWLAKRATRICINFEEAIPHFGRIANGKWRMATNPHPPQPSLSHGEREGVDSPLPMGEGQGVRATPHSPFAIIRTGLPYRPELCQREVSHEQARAHFQLKPERFTVLVIGGSQGAQALNEAVLNTVQHLPSSELQWLHITGTAHYPAVQATADRLGLNGNYLAVPFLDAHEMGLAYRTADCALARGGAGTITELALNALPMILVPYPYSAGQHQRYNCQAMVVRGAGTIIEQEQLTPQRLAETLLDWHACPEKRKQMGESARSWAVPDATERVIQQVLHLFFEAGGS